MTKTKGKTRENRISVELDADIAPIVKAKGQAYGRGGITEIINAALRAHYGLPDPRVKLTGGRMP